MRTALSTLEVTRPRTLDQAVRALHDSVATGRLTPFAGGTDLFVYLNAGSWTGSGFLDLSTLDELRGIRLKGGMARIGAMTSFTEIREHPALRREFPSLIAAASVVGAVQIQNRATLGGNIANASPAGDSLPVLMALDAVVFARSIRGEREVALESLYRGYRDLALEPDELIAAIGIPVPAARTFQFFRKVGTRQAQSISKVVFAGALRLGRGGAVEHVRLAYGSVAPVTLRARRAEVLLSGAEPRPSAAAAARGALPHDIAPIDDIRSDRDYRVEVAGNLLEQFLRAAHPGFARA